MQLNIHPGVQECFIFVDMFNSDLFVSVEKV